MNVTMTVQRKIEREDVTESYFYECINTTFAECDWTCTTLMISNMVRGLQSMLTGEVIIVEVQHGDHIVEFQGRVERHDERLQSLANEIERRA